MFKLRASVTTLCLGLALMGCQMALGPTTLALTPNHLQTQSTKGQHTLTGQFRTHANLTSAYLKNARNILVYLPPSYTQSPQKRYPVLYMHDGNNLFDRATGFMGQEWEVDEHTEALIKSGQIQDIIIVGIYNSPARMDEYTWHPAHLDGQTQGGQGAAYGRFMVEELKPLIDQTYRTLTDRDNTAVMGSSLGGLISYYLGQQYPQVFGKIGMMSPSIWWADRKIIQDAKTVPANLKFWVDIGTQEGSKPSQTVQNTRDFVQQLEQKGYQHFKSLAFHIDEGAGHNEQAWAQRIDRPLQFFFGRTAKP